VPGTKAVVASEGIGLSISKEVEWRVMVSPQIRKLDLFQNMTTFRTVNGMIGVIQSHG
jgi:hypothetical protein